MGGMRKNKWMVRMSIEENNKKKTDLPYTNWELHEVLMRQNVASKRGLSLFLQKAWWKTLGISNRSGLTNIISEFSEGTSIHLYEEVQDVQYDGGYPLSVITAGHKVPNPSEVLGSKRFAKFLNQARQEFGYIIIDCPPVAIASDAIPLCNVSDGVLYVVDSKSSDKRKVKAAINDVERNGGHVMGIVLNKVESATDSNYGYGYGYGYGGEDNGKKKKK